MQIRNSGNITYYSDIMGPIPVFDVEGNGHCMPVTMVAGLHLLGAVSSVKLESSSNSEFKQANLKVHQQKQGGCVIKFADDISIKTVRDAIIRETHEALPDDEEAGELVLLTRCQDMLENINETLRFQIQEKMITEMENETRLAEIAQSRSKRHRSDTNAVAAPAAPVAQENFKAFQKHAHFNKSLCIIEVLLQVVLKDSRHALCTDALAMWGEGVSSFQNYCSFLGEDTPETGTPLFQLLASMEELMQSQPQDDIITRNRIYVAWRDLSTLTGVKVEALNTLDDAAKYSLTDLLNVYFSLWEKKSKTRRSGSKTDAFYFGQEHVETCRRMFQEIGANFVVLVEVSIEEAEIAGSYFIHRGKDAYELPPGNQSIRKMLCLDGAQLDMIDIRNQQCCVILYDGSHYELSKLGPRITHAILDFASKKRALNGHGQVSFLFDRGEYVSYDSASSIFNPYLSVSIPSRAKMEDDISSTYHASVSCIIAFQDLDKIVRKNNKMRYPKSPPPPPSSSNSEVNDLTTHGSDDECDKVANRVVSSNRAKDEAALLLEGLKASGMIITPIEQWDGRKLSDDILSLVPKEEMQCMLAALEKRPKYDTLSEIDGIVVYNKSVHRITSFMWLDDIAISWAMFHLQKRNEVLRMINLNHKKCLFLDSFFFAKLVENNKFQPWNVRRFLKYVKVFQLDQLYVPINRTHNHWFGAVVNIMERNITFYEPKGEDGSDYLHAIFLWIQYRWNQEFGQPMHEDEIKLWTFTVIFVDIPQQPCDIDCGLFLILCFLFLSDGLDVSAYNDVVTSYKVHNEDTGEDTTLEMNAKVRNWRENLAVSMYKQKFIFEESLYDSSGQEHLQTKVPSPPFPDFKAV